MTTHDTMGFNGVDKEREHFGEYRLVSINVRSMGRLKEVTNNERTIIFRAIRRSN